MSQYKNSAQYSFWHVSTLPQGDVYVTYKTKPENSTCLGYSCDGTQKIFSVKQGPQITPPLPHIDTPLSQKFLHVLLDLYISSGNYKSNCATYPIEHQVSALASDLSIEFRYDTNASWTFPRLEKHLFTEKE